MTCGRLWQLVLGVLEEKADPVPDSSAEAVAQTAPAQTDPPTPRELGAMETAIRTLIPLARLYDQAGPDLFGLSLTAESEYPLPPLFIPATVYLTGYLLGGDTRLNRLYADECETIRKSVPTEISALGRP